VFTAGVVTVAASERNRFTSRAWLLPILDNCRQR
jgi:hypothetical protein